MEKSAARGNGQIKIITSWLRKRVPPGDVVEAVLGRNAAGADGDGQFLLLMQFLVVGGLALSTRSHCPNRI